MTNDNGFHFLDAEDVAAVLESSAEFNNRIAGDAERRKRDAERKARDAQIAAFRLLLDYLKNAHEACEAFGLENPSQEILAALIVAQSNDWQGEAVTEEMAASKSRMSADLEILGNRIVDAIGGDR